MLSFLLRVAAKLAMVRGLIKLLGGLGILVPLVLLLKFIGLPILAVLGVVAAPVLIVLFLFGLPIFLVLLVGGAVMGFVFSLLSIGLTVLKFALIIGLPLLVLWKLCGWLWGGGRRRDCGPATEGGIED